MMSLGDAAVKLGLPVFPCLENKRPAVESGFKAASTDPTAIRQAFARSGVALIGVPTGTTSGIIVIDVDIRDDRSGMDWLSVNSGALPETRTHKTRSGGLHLLFACPPGIAIRNSASRIAPGVDVRGEGGYIIAPPSAGYLVADHTPPAEMPQWLIRACMGPELDTTRTIAPRLPPRADGGSRYGLKALERECDAIRTAPFGQQEAAINAAGLKVGALVSGGELDEGIALADLLAAGRGVPSQGGREPWASGEVDAKLRRAFEDGQRSPRAAPVRQEPQQIDAPAIEHLNDPGYWASHEQDVPLSDEEWEDMQRRGTGDTVPASGAKAIMPAELLWTITDPWAVEDIPQRPWVVAGYLMRGSVTVVSGPGSAGKSSLMVAWATALAIGSSFGRFKVPAPLRVATYNVEDDANEQKRRFSAMLDRLSLPTSAFDGRLAIIGPSGIGTLLTTGRDGGPLLNTPVMDRLTTFIDTFLPDVLILDPFVELHGAEENDNTAIRAVMAAFRHIAASRQISVVLLHHSRKGAGTPGDPDSLRGASSIVGAARVALTLNVMTDEEAEKTLVSRDDRRNYFRLDGAKSNYAPITDAEWFERQERRIANGEGVAVAWPWRPPSVFRDLTPAQCNAALDRIAAGPGMGDLYAPTRQGRSNQRWVGNALVEMFKMEEGQAKSILYQWFREGVLVVENWEDKHEGKTRPGVIVVNSKRPT